jgi:DNA integrity scanning protein DisA with diadenylate cyclase activity
MRTQYRLIFTAIFNTVEEREKAYISLKTVITATVKESALFDSAVITRDENIINEPSVTEKII